MRLIINRRMPWWRRPGAVSPEMRRYNHRDNQRRRTNKQVKPISIQWERKSKEIIFYHAFFNDAGISLEMKTYFSFIEEMKLISQAHHKHNDAKCWGFISENLGIYKYRLRRALSSPWNKRRPDRLENNYHEDGNVFVFIFLAMAVSQCRKSKGLFISCHITCQSW